MLTSVPPIAGSTTTDLVLARLLLTAKTPTSATTVREDVGKVLGNSIPAHEFALLADQLLRDGSVERRPRTRNGLQLTPAGRNRALSYLGVTELPARTNWTAVRVKYLLPKALQITPEQAMKLDSADRLTAFLLRREYDLPVGATVAAALEALICRKVGRPNESTLDELCRAVLSEVLGSDERLSKADILKQFPRKLSGSKVSGNLADLRQAVISGWLRKVNRLDDNEQRIADESHPKTREVPFDLSAFAATVKRVARDTAPSVRFGSNKVFIAAVWRDSQQEDGFPRMPVGEFKEHLVAANRKGLLRLEPADLVQVMDTALVAESRTEQAGAVFHFILIEESRP